VARSVMRPPPLVHTHRGGVRFEQPGAVASPGCLTPRREVDGMAPRPDRSTSLRTTAG
jgi:hypothetical protein